MASAPRVLVVDTSNARAFALQQMLDASGFETSHCVSIAAGVASLERSAVDVIIVAASDASDVAPLIGEADHAQVVVRVDELVGVSKARAWGAYDILSHDATFETLLPVIDRAAREAGMRRELALHRSRAANGVAAALIGRSSAMKHVRELIGRAAASQRTVLVTGEAGVGKDVVARQIHDLSERATRPYLLLRCSDASFESFEEELFGVAPSAAVIGRVGLLETARGGTVVLDDCTALSAGIRARIADAIVNRAAPRVGGETSLPLDVRFILMARDSELAEATSLRADALLGGVSVDRIVVPPLRERRSDVPLLVQHFRARLALENGHEGRAPAANAVMTLMAQQWPGNVRELEHRIERDLYGSSEPSPASVNPGTEALFAIPSSAPWTIEQLERRYIEYVLAQEDGNQSRAADRLGIDRRTLYRKLKEYRDDGPELSRAG
jgi:DNA-binding NtrC family response regulator